MPTDVQFTRMSQCAVCRASQLVKRQPTSSASFWASSGVRLVTDTTSLGADRVRDRPGDAAGAEYQHRAVIEDRQAFGAGCQMCPEGVEGRLIIGVVCAAKPASVLISVLAAPTSDAAESRLLAPLAAASLCGRVTL